MPDPTLRFFLRDQTAAVHGELDALVGHWSDRTSYTHYLRALLSFRDPVEQALERTHLPGPFADWAAVPIRDHLRTDLAELGAAAPPTETVPPPASAAAVAGMLYVLEGSSVGARLLSRRAGELGLSADHGARHLAAQTADKGRWPAFLDRLETPGLDREAAAAGANRTFAFALAAFRAEIGA